MSENNNKKEVILNPIKGLPILCIVSSITIILIFFLFIAVDKQNSFYIKCIVFLIVFIIWFSTGFRVINPNESAVFTLFGNYYGTIYKSGFYWINPFCLSVNPFSSLMIFTTSKISLKAITLNNGKQKINDKIGNPIEIGVIVIWKVINATKAVFEVDNYKTYLSTQADASIRQVARQYPYDALDENDEKSLRGSSIEVSNDLKNDLQSRVNMAGIQIIDARISHLAYAQEIAAIMLQRQQADAIISAKQKIVEGAVDIVEMAVERLTERNVVSFDNEKKATLVSNLLLILCGNKDVQPTIHTEN